jgi:hypothetical protein
MAKAASSRPVTTEAAVGGGIAARDTDGDPTPVGAALGRRGPSTIWWGLTSLTWNYVMRNSLNLA